MRPISTCDPPLGQKAPTFIYIRWKGTVLWDIRVGALGPFECSVQAEKGDFEIVSFR